ncbi:MAG TPA: hypothetical protein VMF32_00095 [Xanthobacteraceae bacterium]|nr:hypothetical protein [Xanthobacteraceae bacterium]
MSNLYGKSQSSFGSSGADPETQRLVGRARLMMIVSALTTVIAIAAVTGAIGYRVLTGSQGAIGTDGTIPLPKGSRVISTAASGGRIAVLFDLNGASELRTFDIRTLKETGRVRFSPEP